VLHPLDTALLLALGVFHAGRALPPRDVALVPQQLRFGMWDASQREQKCR
jgi:hypothetical protein